MSHHPDFETFSKLAQQAELVPVYRRVLGDGLTPVSAFHRLDHGLSACLFESVVGGEKVGRYSFITADPYLLLEAYDKRVKLTRPEGEPEEYEADDPLAELEKLIARHSSATLPDLPPFCGGAVGFAGYDTVRYIERLPNAPQDDRGLPDLSFAFFDRLIVFDHINKTITVIAAARLDQINDPQQAYKDAQARVDDLVAQLERPDPGLRVQDIEPGGALKRIPESNFKQEEFEAAVERCREYIRAGDIFQVVLSQRLTTTLTADAFEVYRTLRVVNPSPFMFYVRMPSCTLVGSSPEVMVRVKDGQVTVRPLAGTRPRGKNEEEDRALAEDLLQDEKERAEHVMLVDLGRNDVGRVCQFGTVELSDVMTIERYSHVMHITSNVTGQLSAGKTAFDALRACVPAGTVSAPKVRAMEIIDELEPHRRGPYAGAVGYIDFTGNMDTCITLRTMVIQGDRVYVQAGAGIVADSVPANEYQETLNKARGLLKAIEITEERLS